MTLPPNYLRSLSSLAEIMEREVLELLRLLKEHDKESPVILIQGSFTPQQRQEMIRKLEDMLEKNRSFFRELKAKQVVYTEKQLFEAKVTHLWTVLNDSLPAKTKGYGQLTKEQREWIDRQVGELLTLIKELGQE